MNKQLAMVAIMISTTSATLAQNEVSNTVRYSTDVPQGISVDSPIDPSTAAEGVVMNVRWTVSSNNAFRYKFTGNSKDDDGIPLSIPRLHKQDVDASGDVVANNYDHLDTTAGVLIDSYQSVQTADQWGDAATATGSIINLVKAETDAASPYGTTGRIMPGDNTSEANISLYIKGNADPMDQSGLYNSEVTLTVTADEQES